MRLPHITIRNVVRHFNIRIFGLVQGVLFRQAIREKARESDIRGFVINEPGGSVYVEAEGEEKGLQKFIEWCRKGPSLAKVEKVEIRENTLKNFSGFEVKR